MDDEIREVLMEINTRLTKIETKLDAGDFEMRIRQIEQEHATKSRDFETRLHRSEQELATISHDFDIRLRQSEQELATLRGHRAILTVIASVAFSAAVTLLIRFIS
jgi:uncharacterized protein (DUF3084 family)